MKLQRRKVPHRIVMLCFEDAHILDITGPLEVFASASRWLVESGERTQPTYSVEVVARSAGPFRTSSGIEMVARRSYREVRTADTLLVAGGLGSKAAARDAETTAWIAQMATRTSRIGSVCTGALLLAAAGVLKGRAAVTHWAYCDQLALAEPLAKVCPDAIYVRSGNVYTSAGVTAGMDMALAMVEEDCGRHVAIAVAQELVMFLKRSGGQSQFSRLLQAQAREGSRFEELLIWMQEHLGTDLCIARLASRQAMSARNFARRFTQECGVAPAAFVAQLRLDAAREQLERDGFSIKEIARRFGFGNEQNLRRAFFKAYGVAPAQHRAHFQ